MIWTWVNSVLILQKRQTVWGMHKHKCRLQNTCSNPFPEFKVNKAQVGGSQVLRATLDLWCQTRGKSTGGNGEVSDKVGGLEKEMLFILDRRCVKGCCRKETDAPFLHAYGKPKSWLKWQERIPVRNKDKKFSKQKAVNHSSALPGALFPWEDYWRSLRKN